MRGKPTAQCQRAIDALKAAGYKRNEFRCRTKWESEYQGYGNASITVWASKERQRELAIEVAKQGIQVLFIMKDGELGFPLYYEHEPPGIVVLDLDRPVRAPWDEEVILYHERVENLYSEE